MSYRLYNESRRTSPPDEGFPVDIIVPASDFRIETTWATLTSSTAPTIAMSGGNVISWAPTVVAKVYANLRLPFRALAARQRPADRAYRVPLQISVLASNSGATDGAINFNCSINLRRKNGTTVETATWTAIAKATLDPGGATPIYNTLVFDFWTVDGSGGTATDKFIKYGDQVSMEIYPSAHANNTVTIQEVTARTFVNGGPTDFADRSPWR